MLIFEEDYLLSLWKGSSLSLEAVLLLEVNHLEEACLLDLGLLLEASQFSKGGQ